MIEAAVKVLESANRPLSAQEIYAGIVQNGFFEFKAKEPLNILKSQLRRNSVSLTRKSAIAHPILDELAGKLFKIR